ncbi:helix-turn-helix transcriptional regulator [Synechococcus sp. PCC 6312]|uniref:ArsR/SmtB family transcription factor n=1 Tax=Synechococcus sp. (strain ATCC 27167 / PCC 6312) TaxID=195253 RepID=UPI00029ECD51|nr:metalloregulator ArsR/SmtB family transcription factor [Synechococcus sp. PCC 6312]AFY59803.1 putative transcriptional regulator [Synechococcus sp. PCC 6312]
MIAQITSPDQTVLLGFHALSDPIRLDVLTLLQQEELCVCDLCTRLQVSQSKLSFHLRTLKNAGLVLTRQSGRWIYYRLNIPAFANLEQYLAEYRHLQPRTSQRQCS